MACIRKKCSVASNAIIVHPIYTRANSRIVTQLRVIEIIEKYGFAKQKLSPTWTLFERVYIIVGVVALVKSGTNWVYDRRIEDAKKVAKLLKEKRLHQVELNQFQTLNILKKQDNDQKAAMELLKKHDKTISLILKRHDETQLGLKLILKNKKPTLEEMKKS